MTDDLSPEALAQGDLATRLEAGPGSRELSIEALLALGWKELPFLTDRHGTFLRSPSGRNYSRSDPDLPLLALSVDDGLALLQGTGCWRLDELHEDDEGEFSCALILRRDTEVSVISERPTATPAPALAAAIVRAKEQETASE